MKINIMIVVMMGLWCVDIKSAPETEAKDLAQFFNANYKHYEDQYLQGDFESISGPGSTLEQTYEIRKQLPIILQKYQIASLLDAPCGDFHWMQQIDLSDCRYYGIDIVDPIINKLQQRYMTPHRSFMVKNIINDTLPKVDLIICRDGLVHFSYEAIWLALANFKKSGARYLLTTTFTHAWRDNYNISNGGWFALNLQKAPFNFPAPLYIINEQCTEQGGIYNDKSLALWCLDDIVIP